MAIVDIILEGVVLPFGRERTVYNFYDKLWNGDSKKVKLYIADSNGLPIDTSLYEIPAVLDLRIGMTNTVGVTKAENKYVYQESVMQELETVSITAEIRKEHADEVAKFMIPGNWCFICSYKSAGGVRKVIFTDPNSLSKKYQMVSCSITDAGWDNTLSAQLEFLEVRTYDLQKANTTVVSNRGGSQNKPPVVNNAGEASRDKLKPKSLIVAPKEGG